MSKGITNDAAGYEWRDISMEAYREYVYPDGTRYRVDSPNIISVSASGGHRIHRKDPFTNVYVVPGWVAVEWDGDFSF